MNKNKFFEKVGKLTFSIILTGVLVTGLVIAAGTTWQTYNDGDPISGIEWQKMVTEIGKKVNIVDLPNLSNFYTKPEANTQFTTAAEVIENVMNTCKICIAQGDSNNPANFSSVNTTNNYSCTDFGNIGRLNLLGNVDSNDQLAFKIECGVPGVWSTVATTSYSGGCGSQRTINNQKSGFCSKSKPNNVYYAGENNCRYFLNTGKFATEPIEVPGYRYSSTKTQTCN